MKKLVVRFISPLVVAAMVCVWSASAEAQVPTPTSATPTVHGGTPINGIGLLGEVGYAALRASLYLGGADRDFGIELAAPTFGNDTLPGWGQSLGIDARVPFRFLLVRWAKANGALKVGPYFHAGRACYGRDWHGPGRPHDWHRNCGMRSVGLGGNIGFVTDIALPKLFKLIVGIEQQFGLLHMRHKDLDLHNNEFAGATWVDLGLEALWRDIFFTMIMNMGAQYGSNGLYEDHHALFRQMFGVGLKL